MKPGTLARTRWKLENPIEYSIAILHPRKVGL